MRQAWQTAAGVADGSLSAVEVVAAALAAISEGDDEINAFTVRVAERALAEAAEVERGERTGPLAGVPISVKDHVWVRGLPATNGSRALADHHAEADCACVTRLIAAGAIIVGKTNNPEFCYRGTTENEVYGLTRNPRNLARTPGGSSGGAAASVAAGMVPLAVGTDGGGSIRIPSAFCGVAGLKPTFGLVPKMPGFRGWPTLSVTGPIASSVRDLALAVSVMAGPSALDPLSYPGPKVDYLRAVSEAGLTHLRIAFSYDLGFAELDPDVRTSFGAAIDRLAGAGAELRELHPVTADPIALWDSIAIPEGFASEGSLVLEHRDLVGADAAALALAGRDVSAVEYLNAQERRDAFSTCWAAFLDSYDAILTPTMPVTAFGVNRLAPASIAGNPVPESFDAWCALALPANLAGLPACSLPIGPGRDAMPVGLQIMGPRWADAKVLTIASAIEQILS